MKIIKSKKPCVLLTGTLLEADRLTITEEKHNAGVIISRKEKDLVKTNNGLYRLLGKIIGGSPNELYQECLSNDGVPMRWRKIISKHSDVNKNPKRILNLSLNSPAAPIISIKPPKKTVNLDMSMTRAGKIYSHNIIPHRKRKNPDDEVSCKSKTKYAAFNEKSPLLASTPKRPKKQPVMYETPTQILKKKLHQNIQKETKSRTLKEIDDSIKVTKKRRSGSKEQAGKLLKQKSPIKTPQFMSSANSSKSSTKKSILQQSSLKLSINSTKSSGKQTPLSERNEKTKNKIKPNVKTKSTKIIETVEPLSHSELKKNVDNSKNFKGEVAEIQKKVKRPNSPVSGIFGDINFDSFDNSNMTMNVMLSPGKLSVVSGSEKSRCETPPLFGLQWNSGTKSLVVSEPPTPLGKLVEAKALKRVKPPKITVDEEIKKIKRNNKSLDFKTISKEMNMLLQFGRQDNEY
uniref:SANTA domain-containing protein n=2 Tax=Sipha flava TaxID=143950 RepID=A0A2S2Q063_9HEMI